MANRFKKRKRVKAGRMESVSARAPVQAARPGDVVVLRNSRTAEQHAEMQRELRARYPSVVADIDRIVREIATLVSQLPPLELLQRAWWTTTQRRIQAVTESELTAQDGHDQRMIDYVQSVIASVPRSPTQRALGEADWQSLSAKVEELFRLMNFDFPACGTAVAQASPDFDENLEEFRVKAQMYWVNVRGHRYQVHEPEHLRELLVPHTAVFQELFGISAEQFVDEMTKLLHNFAHGIIAAIPELDTFRNEVLEAMRIAVEAGEGGDGDFGDLMARVVSENGWEDRGREIMGRVLGPDAFDVQCVTNLPQGLLDHLAWSEGADTDFFAPGEMSGWPLRVWPVFRRPFIRIDGRYYCFDHYSLFDGLYRSMQRLIQQLKPEYRQPWNVIQTRVSEELPFSYLTRILPGATVFRSVYYPIENRQWAEADGLLLFEDYLFVVEVKGRGFTIAPPTTDCSAYIASLGRLVLDPANQGRRFLRYLESADSVPIFDAEHRQVAMLQRRDFRVVTLCGVTLDSLTELAAQVQHLRKIGVDVGTDPVWSVSLDDLRVFAEVFANPLTFAHFVEQRMAAFKSNVVELEDELDHLGMYFEHNHYATYANDMRGDERNTRLTFAGYRDKIDRFFQGRLSDPSLVCDLGQNVPQRIAEMVSLLASKPAAGGRARLASAIMDWGGDRRDRVAAWIDQELATHPTSRRPQPVSVIGDDPATAYCWSPLVPRNAAAALEQARAVLLLHGDEKRLLLELTYDAQLSLYDVAWTWITRDSIPEAERPRLETEANDLRRARVARALQAGAIGRNDQCPCGSRKKFKKCCMDRS
jgi:hypothetical protein